MSKKRSPQKTTRSARRPKLAIGKAAAALISVATDARKGVKQRVQALARAPLAACESNENLQAMLKVLVDRNEPIQVRLRALQSLQAATFSVVSFESCRGDYIAALRQVAEDPDAELRQRVLGILAREKDGFAQEKLLEGLKDPSKALVPSEKALQLLSYDMHSEAYPVAREIVENPPTPTAKREALRLLAADANSAPLFEKILRDKNEISENRQISAAALQAVDPEKLKEHAREILLDPKEYKEIQAASLNALTQFGDKAIAADAELRKRVEGLKGKASTLVKKSAQRFLGKFGQ